MSETFTKTSRTTVAGPPDAEELITKSKLSAIIQDIIEARQLSQAEAAQLMGIDEAAGNMILRGRLKDFPAERLTTLIERLIHGGRK